MKSISIRFALIASITFIVWVCMEHLLGYNTTKMQIGQYTRLASAYLFWMFIVITIVVKKKELRGIVSFASLLSTGVHMVIIYSVITAVWLAIYQHFINPDFYPLIKQFSLEQLQAERKTDLEIVESMKEIEMSYNGSVLSYLFYFLFSSIAGSIIAAIAALIMRSKKSMNHKYR